jgi:hypothetical protein
MREEQLARAKLLRAIEEDPRVPLPAGAPGAFVALFREVKAAATRSSELTRASKRKWWLPPLALMGAGAAGGAVVARQAKPTPTERTNQAPTASVSVAPDGAAIKCATRVSFSASASDPDGEALSYTWTIHDGSEMSPRWGATTSYVYQNEGNNEALLTVRDGLTQTTASRTVVARSLTGRWRTTSAAAFVGFQGFDIDHQCGGLLAPDIRLDGIYTPAPTYQDSGGGSVVDPRRVSFSERSGHATDSGLANCTLRFEGEVDSTGDSMTGTLSCSWCDPCRGHSMQITLIRQ